MIDDFSRFDDGILFPCCTHCHPLLTYISASDSVSRICVSIDLAAKLAGLWCRIYIEIWQI